MFFNAIRARTLSEHSHNHASVLRAFHDVVGWVGPCTVQVLCDDKQVALGTILDARGFIATKGSELQGPVTCVLADGTRYSADCWAWTVGAISRS